LSVAYVGAAVVEPAFALQNCISKPVTFSGNLAKCSAVDLLDMEVDGVDEY